MKLSCAWSVILGSLLLIAQGGIAAAQGVRVSTVEPAKSLEEIEKQIDRALDSLVDLELEESTTLAELAESLSAQYEINVVLDEAGLDLVGVAPDEAVSGALRGLPLRSALRLLLKQKDLTYTVDDGVLLLTSRESAGEHLVTKTYEVASLRRNFSQADGIVRTRVTQFSMSNFDELEELLRATIEPDSWDEMGGMGTLSTLISNDRTVILTVLQTQESHERIAKLINDLKKIQGANADAVAAVNDKADGDGEEVANANEIRVQVYALDASLTAEQGQELIEAALDDVQWDAEASFIKPIADTLVIKQSAAVQARIYTLLSDLGALR